MKLRYALLAFVAALLLRPAAHAESPEAVIIDSGGDVVCPAEGTRYCDLGDGTVKDLLTGLVWLQNARCKGLSTEPNGRANWVNARDAVAALADGQCGLSDGSQPGDWRLPTWEEWASTVARALTLECTLDGANEHPSLTNTPGAGCYADGPQAFLDVQLSYWTSKTDADPTRAVCFDLARGHARSIDKEKRAWVWPVRSAE